MPGQIKNTAVIPPFPIKYAVFRINMKMLVDNVNKKPLRAYKEPLFALMLP